MGLFNLFGPKPTAQDKANAKSSVARLQTAIKKLAFAKSIDAYFTDWDRFLEELEVLKGYEGKGVKVTPSCKMILSVAQKDLPRVEKKVVDRSYDRLQRDLAKLSTDSGKVKKAERFFSELEFYYPRLQESTVSYIETIKAQCSFISS